MLTWTEKNQGRLFKKLESNGEAVVTIGETGRPRIWGLDEYLHRKEVSQKTIRKYKPWKKREKPKHGGYGSRSLGIISSLSRTEIYEEK